MRKTASFVTAMSTAIVKIVHGKEFTSYHKNEVKTVEFADLITINVINMLLALLGFGVLLALYLYFDVRIIYPLHEFVD